MEGNRSQETVPHKSRRKRSRALVLGATFLVFLGGGAFGGYMLLSRPTVEINKVALTFDQVDLGGVVEITVQGRGTLKIENISLTPTLRPPCSVTCIHFPLAVELPSKIDLDVFEYHYLPPLPSAVTVSILGTWTQFGLSFPITIS